MSQKGAAEVILVVSSIVVLSVSLFYSKWKNAPAQRSEKPTESKTYKEVEELRGKNMDFTQLKNYFTALSNKKGAEYAFEVLKLAQIPPNTDLHLLGHVVGDILYKQQGADGIHVCTQDFRNACSHSVVVGLLLDHGTSIIPKVHDACHKAPGGKGAYTMCFHGFGHGVLAYTEYDLHKTVDICKMTGTAPYNNREYIECVGGAIMEMISGGDHDRLQWTAQREKYFSADNPLYPCNADFIPEEAKPQCYDYLTPYLFEVAGADMGRPQPQDFEKAFTYCDLIPESETLNRSACFGGFGKEFTVLAQERDIRRIDQMNDEQLRRVYDWCTLGRSEEAINSCVSTAMGSLYWGGENDRRAAVKFCNLIPAGVQQDVCVRSLIGAVGFYISDVQYKKDFCTEVPKNYQTDCREQLRLASL